MARNFVSGAQAVFLKARKGGRKKFAKGNTAGTPKKDKPKGKPFAEFAHPLERAMALRSAGSQVFSIHGRHKTRRRKGMKGIK